jgi:tetratricopeptide (TPR) repeat protein
VLARNPKHPGATHYLIHAYDDPAHARLALPAARAYAAIAPSSSHARHMPAHIFMQLGMWNEAAESDRAAFAASDERIRRTGQPLWRRDYHSLSWLQYEYLQLGRYRDARALLATLNEGATGDEPRIRTYLGSMTATQAIETRRWAEFRDQQDYIGPDDLFAVGLSATMAGDVAKGEVARGRLQAVAESGRLRELQPIVRIMERQLAAAIALKQGKAEAAVSAATAAATLEDALPPPIGRPYPPKPSRELLGEILLDTGRTAEAAAEFRRVLARSANRALSLLGLARASSRSDDREGARRHARALLVFWRGADAELAERQELTNLAR